MYTQKSTSYIAILKFLTQTFIPSPVLSAPLSTGRIGRSSVLSSFVLLRVASVSQLSFPPVLQFRANLSHCQSAAPEWLNHTEGGSQRINAWVSKWQWESEREIKYSFLSRTRQSDCKWLTFFFNFIYSFSLWFFYTLDVNACPIFKKKKKICINL